MINFRRFIAIQLRKLANFIDYQIIDTFTNRASSLIMMADKLKSSGEYKRHHVYSRLIKEFPQIPKRQIALEIEKILSGF